MVIWDGAENVRDIWMIEQGQSITMKHSVSNKAYPNHLEE